MCLQMDGVAFLLHFSLRKKKKQKQKQKANITEEKEKEKKSKKRKKEVGGSFVQIFFSLFSPI